MKTPRRGPALTFACAASLAAGLAFAPGYGVMAQDGAVAIDLGAESVPLDPADPARRRIGALEYMGGLVLTSDEPAFGGLSGLDVSDDGRHITAVSDHGLWLTARLVHDAGGALIGVEDALMAPIRDAAGRPVRQPWHDSEDLARLADGSYAVSFERRTRLMLYPSDAPFAAAPGRLIPFPAEAAALPANGSIEGLAQLADGSLLAVAESPIGAADTSLAWLFPPGLGTPAPLAYRQRHEFRPTALAMLPGGDVLALERRFTVVSGAAARLVRIPAESVAPGAVLDGAEIARIGVGLTVDNFEGLAVRRGADGATHLYIVSDDNYSGLQRTLLLHFRLAE